MKYLKYTGLYFVMVVMGDSILKIAEANEIWTAFLFGGAFLWYLINVLEKDS